MEKPNLQYIDQLARGDNEVKKTLINVIKTEFPDDKKDYQESLDKKDLKEIQQNVHRIKHKFSILGLESSYENANNFEQSLIDGSLNNNQEKDFNKTLIVITEYLKTI